MPKLTRCALALLLLLFCLPVKTIAASDDAISLSLENDSERIGGPGTDEGYTNGLDITYFHASDHVPLWGSLLQPVLKAVQYSDEPAVFNFSFSVGHKIFTPVDTSRRSLIINDRPYAAWFYTRFDSVIRYQTHVDIWGISLGFIGPAAFGEAMQREFHKIIGAESSNGWRNQLGNEFALYASYLRYDRLAEIRKKEVSYFDIYSLVGGKLGNVMIDLSFGFQLRAGYILSRFFRPHGISDFKSDIPDNTEYYRGGDFSFYLLAGVKGNSVAHNIFLDGNTFTNSHSVDRIPFVGEVEFGLVARIKKFAVTWRRVWRGPEFRERKEGHSFGTLMFTITNVF